MLGWVYNRVQSNKLGVQDTPPSAIRTLVCRLNIGFKFRKSVSQIGKSIFFSFLSGDVRSIQKEYKLLPTQRKLCVEVATRHVRYGIAIDKHDNIQIRNIVFYGIGNIP